jgi:hypothetical protein
MTVRTRWVDYKDHEFDPCVMLAHLGLSQILTLRQVPDRAWLARVDVVHGRQVSCRGQALAASSPCVGAKGAQAVLDLDPFRLQAIQHVCWLWSILPIAY